MTNRFRLFLIIMTALYITFLFQTGAFAGEMDNAVKSYVKSVIKKTDTYQNVSEYVDSKPLIKYTIGALEALDNKEIEFKLYKSKFLIAEDKVMWTWKKVF